jgi:molecular chaperone GrpE
MENNTNNQPIEQNSELESCKNQLTQAQSTIAYLTADFDNYRRRMEKERINWQLQAQNNVLLDLVVCIDHLKRVMNDLTKNQTQPIEAHLHGLELTYKEMQKLLRKYEIEEVQTQTFDPELHEAIMQETVEGKESGTIARVIEPGYIRKGMLLRAAKVSVVS